MDETVKVDGLAFWRLYKQIGKSNIPIEKFVSPKRCRFCGKTEPAVTFNMVAHVCPELLGENNIVSYEECDRCNQHFSAYESHLSKFFLPYLSILQIKGKKKNPEFHSRTELRNEYTRTIIRSTDKGRLQLIIGKEDDLIIDQERKMMSIRFRLPPHKPLFVYKALVKIGLSLLPSELITKYRNVFEWVSNEDKDTVGFIPTLLITRLNKKKFAQPYAELYEANKIFDDEGFYPELTLILNFGNLVTQIFLPLSDEFDYPRSNGQSPLLEIYPASFLYSQDKEKYRDIEPTEVVTLNYHFDSVNLGSYESCVRDAVLNFTFQEIESFTGAHL